MFAALPVCKSAFLFTSTLLILGALSAILLSPDGIRGDEKKSSDPWPSSQTLQAADLTGELAGKNGTPPTVVYVGFRTLFAGGHIAGASFNGTASSEQGLAELRKLADHLPRSTNLVLYCGCCPFEKCPNIRPAFAALRGMGFKKLRVLVLPTSFATDWVDKGYPIQKGM
jgi:thiosulfate/3-mercaptopyruvate sulfurtransferase